MDLRQFDRAPSHKKPELPRAEDLAALIREGGETAVTLAAEYRRDASTIRQRLTMAGYNSGTGEPVAASLLAVDVEADGRPQLGLAQLVRDDQPWAEAALCAQTDPESFFPEKGGSTREAKAVCKKCTVRAECLDYAIDHDERFGIWGGMSERDRRKLKRVLEAGGDVDEPEADAS